MTSTILSKQYNVLNNDDLESSLPLNAKKSNCITWANVSFKAGSVQILDNCWGDVAGGKVCAIMGPSGSGKSSLLNVLAGRSAARRGIEITGKITVGGNEINPVQFRQNIAYVMQDDALLATATPREALEFSASLRLPADTSRDSISALVSSLLEELGLEDCADTMIGGPLIKGISGGQRKRTSVGVEIITNPSLLFLDEPTSGLDSFSAYNCINLLKKVAQRNTAVLCTIHQPSSEVFFLFDLVIFLRGGRVFYQGPSDEVVNYFSERGFECPANYNPSDYIMFVCQTESVVKLQNKGLFMQQPAYLPELREATLLDKALTRAGDRSSFSLRSSSDEYLETIPVKANFFKQMSLLIERELVNMKRDTGAMIGRFGVTVFLNLLFGIVFLNAGNQDDADPDNFNSHFGAISMIVIASMFGCAQPVLLSFPFERPMFMREFSTGTYGSAAYFLSKLTLELPLTFVQTLTQYVIVYFLVNMQGDFIYLVMASWGLGIASSSVAMFLGCAVPDVKSVTELAPMLFVPQLLFAGFFVRTSKIPIFLRWAQYLCSMKYAIDLIIITEFNPDLASCQGAASMACDQVASSNDVIPKDWWIYSLLLFSLFVGFRLCGAVMLVYKSKQFY